VDDKSHGGVGQARAALKLFMEEAARPAPRPASASVTEDAVTFADALTAYIDNVESTGATVSTVRSFRYSIRRVPEALGAKPLGQVTTKGLDLLCAA
jgi:hypothetical protein